VEVFSVALPSSIELAVSDYHLFRSLEKHLEGKHFTSDEEVKTEVHNGLGLSAWIPLVPG
jgi:hypothetical protein